MSRFSYIISLSFVLLFSGCAMKSVQYESVSDLQKESMTSISQQVLDGMVAVLDDAELPAFFYIEAAQSSWGGSYNAGMGAQITPRWSADNTVLSPNIGGGENLGFSLQVNDFGPAPMTRVTGIYAFLCNPISIGNGTLPNGALYTVVREQDTPKGMLLWSKRNNGKYIGVTNDTKLEFFKLSRDLIYWTRHYQPDPTTLDSAAGNLYAFFAEYPKTEVELADAVQSASKAIHDFNGAMQGYSNAMQSIQKLEEKFQNPKDKAQADVQIAILNEAYKQRGMRYAEYGGAFQSKKEKTQRLSMLERKTDHLLTELESSVTFIKKNDPKKDQIDIDAITTPFKKRIEGIINHDMEIIKEIQYQTPASTGIDARDSVDKLYRDRFEALPDRFDSLFQAQD